MENVKGHFKVKKITNFSELSEGQEVSLPESDLCFQDGNKIFQFEYIEPKEEEKYQIESGVWSLTETPSGITLSKVELRERNLLETAKTTQTIIGEARTFFSRLHIYDKLQRLKKRGVLLASKPGMGKTSAIEKFCAESVKEDAGTVIMIWPTSEIEPESVSRFLSQRSEYTKDCTRLVLIMEDIGGGERDGMSGTQGVTSGLLNFLDGVGVAFKLPTFIVATTNHPENLLASLADRPGRFDLLVELKPPTDVERVQLLEFVSKRPLTEEEKKAIVGKGCEAFSIAHLEEIAVRAELHDKSYAQVIKELVDHAKRFQKGFEDKEGKDFGFNR